MDVGWLLFCFAWLSPFRCIFLVLLPAGTSSGCTEWHLPWQDATLSSPGIVLGVLWTGFYCYCFFISNRISSLAICLFLFRGQRPRIISCHLRCKEDLKVPEVQSSGLEAAGRGQTRGGCPGVARGHVASPQAIRMRPGCQPEKGG